MFKDNPVQMINRLYAVRQIVTKKQIIMYIYIYIYNIYIYIYIKFTPDNDINDESQLTVYS